MSSIDAALSSHGYTLAVILASPMGEALARRGVDFQAILEQAAVDPDALKAPDARISLDKVERIWALVFEATQDESIAIDVARHLHPGSLGPLSFGLFSSVTLQDATERFRRYIHVLTSAATAHCEVVGEEFWVTIKATREGVSPVRRIYFFAILLVLWKTISGPGVTPIRLSMSGVSAPRSPEALRRLRQFFGCEIQYESSENRIVLSLDEAQKVLPAANPELARLGDEMVRQHLTVVDHGVVAPRVRAEILGLLATGDFTKARVAGRMGLGARTLQRRLEAEGVTFRQLVDTTRRGLAESYVREGRLPIKEIAYLLGFSELSNFTRAFRDWFGVPPRAFRDAVRQSD